MSQSRKVYAQLPPYADERQFADACCDELAPYFHIEREVPLTHWTKVTLIVDAVMRPRDPTPWKDDQPIFAVEFRSVRNRLARSIQPGRRSLSTGLQPAYNTGVSKPLIRRICASGGRYWIRT